MIVRVLKYWDQPDLMRQTPRGKGEWDGVRFTQSPVADADLVLVLSRVPETVRLSVPLGRLWCLVQEPPVKAYDFLETGFRCFDRVITQDSRLQGARFFHHQPAVPWWVGRSYEQLSAQDVPVKDSALVWVTSNARRNPGHQLRMTFLDAVRDCLPISLFGKGFHPIEDKWDVLSPAKYALAIENHSGPWYWTEKLADCFLSWTLPFYWGCTNIAEYFPEEAMICIDIAKPAEAAAIIRQAMATGAWERRLEALAEARRRVLEEHQFFPFVRRMLAQTPDEQVGRRVVHLKELPHGGPSPIRRRLINKARRWMGSVERAMHKLAGN